MWSYIVRALTGKDKNSKDSLLADSQAVSTGNLDQTVNKYLDTFNETNMGQDQVKIAERKDGYKEVVDSYYNLVTDFYEYGWGASFHFSPRFVSETFREGTARHEYYLALRLGLQPGKRAIDCGCGVGGPMRSIARFTGAKITGVTINEYQVMRSSQLVAKMGLEDLCETVQGDFMNLPFREEFDCAYAIEATCHAPNKQKCFEEIYKTLKPGGLVAVYEWAMTPLYDPENAYHRKVKHEIEKGDGLPDLPMTHEVVQNFKDAGFEVLEAKDVADEESEQIVPWYKTLQGGYTATQFKHSALGRFITHVMVSILEFLRIAPKGTTATSQLLNHAAQHLAIGGEMKIFTPMYFVLARKPL